MTETKCLICGGVDFTELLNINKFPVLFGAVPAERVKSIANYPLSIAICNKCQLVQQINLLKEDVLNSVYTEEYYNCPSPSTTALGTREIDKFYDFFRQCNLEKGKLLEIACFDGYLLKKLQDDGWDVYGCDPSALTQTAVAQLGQDRIINDFFTDKTYPPDAFDVIIFRNLLEHMYDIHGFIKAVDRCLKKGGRIFIDVPNIKVLLDIGGLGTFFHQHVSYFSLSTLSMLLTRHNFLIDCHHEGMPNLFIGAIKGANGIRMSNMESLTIDIELEKTLFLEKNRKVHNDIAHIFQNEQYRHIGLFGASALATTIINMLDTTLVSKIKNIFDNDTMKHGKYIYGCDVMIGPPADIRVANIDVIILTTYFFHHEIQNQLLEMGVDRNKILTLI